MRGNVFLCLNDTTFNSLIPDELISSYGIPEYDEEGIQNGVIHPTFKELGESNGGKFGANPMIRVDDVEYYIVQLEASWLKGELSSLIKLGEGRSYPSNSLMTSSEASKFCSDNQTDII